MIALPQRPTLIVVTGRPGSGKSTLAHALAQRVRCPLIARDAIKEGLVNTFGTVDVPEAELARRAYDVFFDTIEDMLDVGVTLVAEAAFQNRLWSPKLEAIKTRAQIRILICHVEVDVAKARFIARYEADPGRNQFHGYERQHAPDGWAYDRYDPPNMPLPKLIVDTTQDYRPNLDDIVAFALSKNTSQR